jgi:hypothetical protein
MPIGFVVLFVVALPPRVDQVMLAVADCLLQHPHHSLLHHSLRGHHPVRVQLRPHSGDQVKLTSHNLQAFALILALSS